MSLDESKCRHFQRGKNKLSFKGLTPLSTSSSFFFFVIWSTILNKREKQTIKQFRKITLGFKCKKWFIQGIYKITSVGKLFFQNRRFSASVCLLNCWKDEIGNKEADRRKKRCWMDAETINSRSCLLHSPFCCSFKRPPQQIICPHRIQPRPCTSAVFSQPWSLGRTVLHHFNSTLPLLNAMINLLKSLIISWIRYASPRRNAGQWSLKTRVGTHCTSGWYVFKALSFKQSVRKLLFK